VPPRIVRWTFHSPLRLAAVSLAVAGILAGGAVLTAVSPSSGVRAEPEPAATTSPGAVAATRSAPTPGPSPAPTPAPTPEAAEAVTAQTRDAAAGAARAFVDAWATAGRGRSRADWLQRIEPLTTPTLYRGLRVTDTARLPGGEARDVTLDELGPFAGAATVGLTSGVVLQVQLVTDHGRWVVADVRPAGS
jgi:hypothetical protein